jgi:hypothetical protein
MPPRSLLIEIPTPAHILYQFYTFVHMFPSHVYKNPHIKLLLHT